MTLGFGIETEPFILLPSGPGVSEIMTFCNSKPARPFSPGYDVSMGSGFFLEDWGRRLGERVDLTFHGNGLVEGDGIGRKRTFLQARSAVEVQLEGFLAQDGLGEVQDCIITGVQGESRIDVDDCAIFGADLRNRRYRKRRSCANQRNGCIESENFRVVNGFIAQNLGLVDVNGGRSRVTENELSDVQSGFINISLCDARVSDVNPI